MPQLEVYSYALPLTAPMSHNGTPEEVRRGILLHLVTDEGMDGWGEAAPLPGFSSESFEEVREQCLQLASRSDAQGILSHKSLLPSVRFGFELALLDARARKTNTPLHRIVNPQSRRIIVMNALLAGSRDEVLDEARALNESGYLAVKLKIGSDDLDADIALVAEVSRLLSSDTFLLLDANRAWTFDEARDFGEACGSLKIAYVEEPLQDPAELKALSGYLPIAVDESVAELAAGDGLASLSFACGIVLKPTVLGGISRTWHLAEEARQRGMTVSISSSYESGVGTRMLLALAGGQKDALSGLGTYQRLQKDVLTDPLDLAHPTLNVDTLLADAVSPDLHRLERLM